MNSSSLEKWQAAAIRDALFPSTNYLIRLRRRTEETSFAHDDELYRQECTAHEAVNRLRMSAHSSLVAATGHRKALGRHSSLLWASVVECRSHLSRVLPTAK